MATSSGGVEFLHSALQAALVLPPVLFTHWKEVVLHLNVSVGFGGGVGGGGDGGGVGLTGATHFAQAFARSVSQPSSVGCRQVWHW